MKVILEGTPSEISKLIDTLEEKKYHYNYYPFRPWWDTITCTDNTGSKTINVNPNSTTVTSAYNY